MGKIKATKALYIKLGSGGAYEAASFKSPGSIRLGYHDVHDSIGNNFDKIKDIHIKTPRDSGAATRHANQVYAFYTAPRDTIWITFSKGRMYWCQAEEEVKILGYDPKTDGANGSRYRKTVDGWRSVDINDKPLYISELSGSLTKIAGYRGTICDVKKPEFEYLIRKINGEQIEEVIEAKKSRDNILESICKLMKKLQPKDFELLVDLAFARSGWQRVSLTGGVQEFFDIEMILPSTNERAFVQIKTKTNENEFKKYIKDFREWQKNIETKSSFFYVYHTSKDIDISAFGKDEIKDIHLINDKKLAKMILDAGLFDWLLKKVG